MMTVIVTVFEAAGLTVSDQKTAYEISLGLVGSEMCIRDRPLRNIKRF